RAIYKDIPQVFGVVPLSPNGRRKHGAELAGPAPIGGLQGKTNITAGFVGDTELAATRRRGRGGRRAGSKPRMVSPGYATAHRPAQSMRAMFAARYGGASKIRDLA
ncbi:MAG TPA: hypothetical protein VF693_07670, partial [Allosphingosinicella sp.]